MSSEDILKPDFDFFHNSISMMAFDPQYFRQIIENGFRNQHQVGHTQGFDDNDSRAFREDLLLNLKLEINYNSTDRFRIQNEIRPKYAYGSFSKLENELKPSFLNQYGSVFAVFKPEVKSRTSFSNDDSLENFEGHMQFHTPYYMSSKLSSEFNRLGKYYESQIWGKLTFDDVDYLLVNCPGFPKTSNEVIQILKENNLTTPVFSCAKVNIDADSFNLLPDQLLYGELPPLDLSLTHIYLYKPELGAVKVKSNNLFCNDNGFCSYKYFPFQKIWDYIQKSHY